MRIMLHVVLDREKSNEMVLDGTLGPTIEGILEKLKPETVYAHTLERSPCGEAGH